MSKCPWCSGKDDYEPVNPERELCRAHMNEYDGVSEAGYQRMVSEQRKDFA